MNVSCAHHDSVGLGRFCWIVLGAGPIGLVGVAGSVAGALVFRRLARGRGSGADGGAAYLAALSLLDALICASYVLVFVVDAAVLFLHLRLAFIVYVHYSPALYWASKVAQLSSVYLTMAAAVERLVAVRWPRTRTPSPHSLTIAILLLAFALRTIVLFEIRIQEFPECEGVFGGQLAIVPTELRASPLHVAYEFYFIFIIQVLVPFLGVVALNVGILWTLARKAEETLARPALGPETATELGSHSGLLHTSVSASTVLVNKLRRSGALARWRARVRSAAVAFVCVTTLYLACNALALLINVLERLPAMPWLLAPLHGHTDAPADQIIMVPTAFYILTTDLISFLFMFNSAARFGIFLTFDPRVRQTFWDLVRRRKEQPTSPDHL